MGSWKHSDLPDAVPVVTIVGPAHAAWIASAWWDHSRSMPAGPQRVRDLGVQLLGDRRLAAGLRVDRALRDQALVGPPRLEQLVPRLDVSDDDH